MSRLLKDSLLWNEVVLESLPEKIRDTITVGSHKKILWNCSVCDKEWIDEVRNRTKKGFDCINCYGRTVHSNRLSICFPELSREWLFDKNFPLTPDNTFSKSNKTVWWICSLGHEWKTLVTNRTVLGYGCPYCSNKKFRTGFNDLATLDVDFLCEWDYENNLVTPESAFSNSVKHYWKCEAGHLWKQSVSERLRTTGCPFCARVNLSQKLRTNSVKKSGSLLLLEPKIAGEWVFSDKGLEPKDVSVESGEVVLWKCSNCEFEWSTSVVCRVRRESNCRVCFSKSSEAEKELFNFVKSSIPDYQVLSSNRTIIAPKELDIVIPELDIAIEFNGDYWHSDKKFLETRGLTAFEVHSEKLELARVAGFSLYFVWWSDWISSRQEVEQALIDLFESGVSSVPLLTTLSKD